MWLGNNCYIYIVTYKRINHKTKPRNMFGWIRCCWEQEALVKKEKKKSITIPNAGVGFWDRVPRPGEAEATWPLGRKKAAFFFFFFCWSRCRGGSKWHHDAPLLLLFLCSRHIFGRCTTVPFDLGQTNLPVSGHATTTKKLKKKTSMSIFFR